MNKNLYNVLVVAWVCFFIGLISPSVLIAGQTILTLPGINYYQLDNGAHYDDGFGAAVAISGDYAIVSAPNWDPDEITNEDDYDDMDWGTGWIFKRDQGGSGNWGMLVQLTDSNPRYDPYGRNDHLGYAVAIDGDTCVMCSGEVALTTDWNAEYGACAIYYKDNPTTDKWGIEKWVKGHDAESKHYGYAVAISGDYLIVGERSYGSDWNGSAWIYKRDYNGADNWGSVKTFSGYPEYAAFGNSVDVDGAVSPARVIIGADYNQNGHAGSAYIYEEGATETTWDSAALKEGDVSGDQFGHAVAIDGNWAFVSAPRAAAGGTWRGRVYIYLRDGAGTWNLSETLTASDAADYDQFGSTLSVDDDTLLVGASGVDPAGIVYVYKLKDSTWSYIKKLKGSGIELGDSFGYFYNSVTTVSVSGDNAIVGACGYDTDHSNEGAAFIFDIQSGGIGSLFQLLLN